MASFIVFFFGKTILLVETFVIIRKTKSLLHLFKLLNFRARLVDGLICDILNCDSRNLFSKKDLFFEQLYGP